MTKQYLEKAKNLERRIELLEEDIERLEKTAVISFSTSIENKYSMPSVNIIGGHSLFKNMRNDLLVFKQEELEKVKNELEEL